ncbi:YceI family protein [Kiloniella sp. EL199]|uniref:YceI family protein n=1 Tax=Kiloniella sp. EL199 TaxID=2107581 RepID=UPI000EA11B12|nr:YceI family protein [Kiloniella sp. EL199]
MSFKQSLKVLPTGLAALALSLTVSMANAAEYDIDPTHSFINFKTKHLGFSWLSGTFNKISGTMDFDPAGGADQKVNLVIDTTSLDTNHAERDKHLRSPDFFDVEKYPTATFVSTGYSGDANGGTLSGDLTLHGVTKNISFDVTKIGEGDDPWGGYRAGFEGSYTLKRSDFGMDFNLGPAAEDVQVDLFIEAIKKK